MGGELECGGQDGIDVGCGGEERDWGARWSGSDDKVTLCCPPYGGQLDLWWSDFPKFLIKRLADKLRPGLALRWETQVCT